MTTLKQIQANRLNARKSTGPRTEQGKQRSRQNAFRPGLTSETVITSLENAGDYQLFQTTIYAEYQPRTATTRELVARLASVLWRLRRSGRIETGLLQIQSDLVSGPRRRFPPLPDWYDEMDVAGTSSPVPPMSIDGKDAGSNDTIETTNKLAHCFLQSTRLQFGAFDTLIRYEGALWRQAAQIIWMLHSTNRAK